MEWHADRHAWFWDGTASVPENIPEYRYIGRVPSFAEMKALTDAGRAVIEAWEDGSIAMGDEFHAKGGKGKDAISDLSESLEAFAPAPQEPAPE